jgi:hypothetical protein
MFEQKREGQEFTRAAKPSKMYPRFKRMRSRAIHELRSSIKGERHGRNRAVLPFRRGDPQAKSRKVPYYEGFDGLLVRFTLVFAARFEEDTVLSFAWCCTAAF